jgi:hypothetical protein
MTNKEISDKINNILSNHPKYNGYASMYDMGVKEDERPLVYECSDIQIRIVEVRCRWVTIAVYNRGSFETCCRASHMEIPTKALREAYKIVKNYFK